MVIMITTGSGRMVRMIVNGICWWIRVMRISIRKCGAWRLLTVVDTRRVVRFIMICVCAELPLQPTVYLINYLLLTVKQVHLNDLITLKLL